MSEQIYDDEIAPALVELGRKALASGMRMVASVEWEKGESGSTIVGDMDEAGVGQLMTALAARSNGNIDAFILALLDRVDVSQSIFLHSYNKFT